MLRREKKVSSFTHMPPDGEHDSLLMFFHETREQGVLLNNSSAFRMLLYKHIEKISVRGLKN